MSRGSWSALVIASLLLATGCGGSSTSSSPRETAARTVTVEGATGRVTVPVTDTGIWALDYQNALNLLAIGVVPTHAGRYQYEADPYVLAAYAILEEAGVQLVPTDEIEPIAAAEPELIVGSPRTGNDQIIPRLDGIAPVVLLPDLPVVEDQLETLGAVTGRQDAAATVRRRLDEAERRLARRLDDTRYAGRSVSVLSACGRQYCSYGDARGFGPILTDLGLRRPAPQSSDGNAWGYELVSPEVIDREAGEVTINLGGSVARGGTSPLDEPLLDQGQVTGEVDFSAWFGVGPLNHVWVLNDLEAVLLGEGRVADARDGPRLWSQVLGEGEAR